MALQIRRGTDAERLLITPLQGELIFTTDTKKLYVGDGSTAGGVAVDTVGGGGGGADGNTTYAISAETAAGGVNLRLTGSDASTDDVKLAAGANITITRTDASTITIDSTGGGGGGATALSGLSDVNLSTLSAGQVLKYDGTSWINDTDLTGGIGGIASVQDDTAPTLGGNLNLNNFNVQGTGNIDITGSISSTDKVTSKGLLTGEFYFELSNTNPANGTVFLRNVPAAISHTEVNSLTTGAYGTGLTVRVSRTSLDAPAAVAPGDSLHQEVILGHDGTGYKYASAIIHLVDPFASVSSGDVPGAIGLVTWRNNDAGDLSKSILLDSRGYVSIAKGLTQAQATLDVNGFAKLAVLTAAPASPAEGMIAIADGTSWNPAGTGKSVMVVYLGGGWRVSATAP